MTEAEALSLNEEYPGSDNFSILEDLEKFRLAEGKFEFKLVWPNREGANHQIWKQSTNPVTSTSGGVDGYEVYN